MSGPWQRLGKPRPDGPFEPADEVERALHEAASRGDHKAFTDALLPARVSVRTEPEGGVRRPTSPGYQWVTVPIAGQPGERTALQVFTSRQRVRDAVRGAATADVDFAALIRFWPDPRWVLSLNPGSPLGAELPGDQVVALAERADRDRALRLAAGDFWHRSRTDHELFEAAGAGDLGGFLHILRRAKVEVPSYGAGVGIRIGPADPAFPWQTVREKGRTAVLAFTPGWRQPAAVTGAGIPVRFAELIAHWPDPEWHLVFNTATPLEFALTGEQVRALAAAPDGADADALERLLPRARLPVTAELLGAVPPVAPLQPVPETDDPAESLTLDTPRPGAPASRPDDELERALDEAVEIGARDKFLAALAPAHVLVPVPHGHDEAHRPSHPGFPWRTLGQGGMTTVPVFTSPRRQRTALGDADAIRVPFAALIRYWPDPEWALAVNPGTPCGAMLPGRGVVALAGRTDHAAMRQDVRGFWPQGPQDAALYRALKDGDLGAFVATLLGGRINVPSSGGPAAGAGASNGVPTGSAGAGAAGAPGDPAFPWHPLRVRGRIAVCGFTALHWMHRAEISGARVEPTFRDLVRHWPDPSWSLVVNPGTPLELWLDAGQLRALARTPSDPSAEQVRRALQEGPADTVDGAVEGAEGDGTAGGGSTGSPGSEEAGADGADPAAAGTGGGAPADTLALHYAAGATFRPVLEVERTLHAAATAGDRQAFVDTLLGIQVMVPVARDHDFGLYPGPCVPGFPWRPGEPDERGARTLAVFTTPAAMRAATGDSQFVPAHFGTLVRYWPDGDWSLAVNPGSAIGATLPGPGIIALANRRGEEALWDAGSVPPQNAVERRLAGRLGDATGAGRGGADPAGEHDPAELITLLREAATLYVPTYGRPGAGVLTRPDDPAFPWRPLRFRGRRVIQIFTSAKLQVEAIKMPGFVLATIDDLAARWPDTGWALAVNPGSSIEVVLPGEALTAAAASSAASAAATEYAARPSGAERAPAARAGSATAPEPVAERDRRAEREAVGESSAVEHAAVEHAAVEHAAVEHAAVEHAAAEHAAAEHAAVEHAAAEHAAQPSTGAESIPTADPAAGGPVDLTGARPTPADPTSPRQDSPRHDSSRQDSSRQDSSRHDPSRHDPHDSSRQESPREDSSGQGPIRQGPPRPAWPPLTVAPRRLGEPPRPLSDTESPQPPSSPASPAPPHAPAQPSAPGQPSAPDQPATPVMPAGAPAEPGTAPADPPAARAEPVVGREPAEPPPVSAEPAAHTAPAEQPGARPEPVVGPGSLERPGAWEPLAGRGSAEQPSGSPDPAAGAVPGERAGVRGESPVALGSAEQLSGSPEPGAGAGPGERAAALGESGAGWQPGEQAGVRGESPVALGSAEQPSGSPEPAAGAVPGERAAAQGEPGAGWQQGEQAGARGEPPVGREPAERPLAPAEPAAGAVPGEQPGAWAQPGAGREPVEPPGTRTEPVAGREPFASPAARAEPVAGRERVEQPTAPAEPAAPPAVEPPPAYAQPAAAAAAAEPAMPLSAPVPAPPAAPPRQEQAQAAPAEADDPTRTASGRPFAGFEPANTVEARLLAVGLRGDGDAFLKALITADVLLPVPPDLPRGVNPGSPNFPWVTAEVKGRTGVLLFTSLERLREYLGESQFIVGHCAIIARLWPRDDWALEVNPGTPVGAGLPGDRVRALADWAEEIGVIKRVPPPVPVTSALSSSTRAAADAGADPGPSAGPEPDRRRRPIMQTFTPHDQVDWYLRLGYDRVAGPVYRAREMPWPGSLGRLYEAYGIDTRPDSPFTAADQQVHLVRWPQYCDGLYRAEPDPGDPDRHEDHPRAGAYAIGSIRVPHGAQLIALSADGSERLVAVYSADDQVWRPAADAPPGDSAPGGAPPTGAS